MTWFEIPAAELDRAAKFYSGVLGVSMKTDQIGPEHLSVFPHQEPSVGGSLTVGGQPPAGGVVLYLNASPSLDAQPAYAGRRRSNGAKNAAPPVRVFTRRSAIPKATSWGCMPVARADASCRQIVRYVRAAASHCAAARLLARSVPAHESTGTFKIFRFLAFR